MIIRLRRAERHTAIIAPALCECSFEIGRSVCEDHAAVVSCLPLPAKPGFLPAGILLLLDLIENLMLGSAW